MNKYEGIISDPDEGGYRLVEIPKLNIRTQAVSKEDAVLMLQDYVRTDAEPNESFDDLQIGVIFTGKNTFTFRFMNVVAAQAYEARKRNVSPPCSACTEQQLSCSICDAEFGED